jgi:hypothetical protein
MRSRTFVREKHQRMTMTTTRSHNDTLFSRCEGRKPRPLRASLCPYIHRGTCPIHPCRIGLRTGSKQRLLTFRSLSSMRTLSYGSIYISHVWNTVSTHTKKLKKASPCFYIKRITVAIHRFGLLRMPAYKRRASQAAKLTEQSHHTD